LDKLWQGQILAHLGKFWQTLSSGKIWLKHLKKLSQGVKNSSKIGAKLTNLAIIFGVFFSDTSKTSTTSELNRFKE